MELAFFGGTFTALSEKDMGDCLRFVESWKNLGFIGKVRCSTRPDSLRPVVLARLRDAGFTLVELGVQSFQTAALASSARGYTGEMASQGCAMVRESGLELGIQLLPGMPGHTSEHAREDVFKAISFAPACVRLYPCLVLEGTRLAHMWRNRDYHPWEMDQTVQTLAWACLTFWSAGIPVIRMGLAEEPGLVMHILAGPRHPALGSMVRGLALIHYIQARITTARTLLFAREIRKTTQFRLDAPHRYQGQIWGHHNSLEERYAACGIRRSHVHWWDKQEFALSSAAADR